MMHNLTEERRKKKQKKLKMALNFRESFRRKYNSFSVCIEKVNASNRLKDIKRFFTKDTRYQGI